MRGLNTFLTAVLAVFIISGCASTGTLKEPEVTSSYDKFEDHTVLTTTEARVYGGTGLNSHFIWLSGWGVCPGEKSSCSLEEYALRFKSESDGWRLLENYSLNLIIDGERFEVSQDQISTNRDVVYGSNVRESLVVSLSPEAFKKLASSQNVEARIGGYELDMSWERREILRLLAARTNLTNPS